MDKLSRYLSAEETHDIPWAKASAFFLTIKEQTKEAESPSRSLTPEQRARINRAAFAQDAQQAKYKGLMSGIRSSAAADVREAEKTKRQRGKRVGGEVGTVGGAAAGYMAGRKAGIAGKIGGTAIGALMGRGLGKTVGEEIDRKRTIKKYNKESASPGTNKKAEMEKWTTKTASISRVREMWKLADGIPEGEALPGGADNEPVVVEPEVASEAKPSTMAEEKMTPDVLERQRAEQLLAEEAMADQMSEVNEAEYYRQVAQEAMQGLEEMQAMLQQTQAAAEQAGQQAQMSQMQADQAVQQATQQSQDQAMQNQQLTAQLEAQSQELAGSKQAIMQMRQAMQNYREHLQDLALQDPTAAAGPSPEEQGMMEQEAAAREEAQAAEAGAGAPMSGESAKQVEEAQQAQEEAGKQTAQAERATAKDQAKQEAKDAGVTVNVGGQTKTAFSREDALLAVVLHDLRRGKAIGATKAQQKREYRQLKKRGKVISGPGRPAVVALRQKTAADKSTKRNAAIAAGIAGTAIGGGLLLRKAAKSGKLRELIARTTNRAKKTGDVHQSNMKKLEELTDRTGKVRDELKDLNAWMSKQADWSSRAVGAGIGAAGAAGLQSASDRVGPKGISEKERILRAKLRHYQQKKDKGALDKYKVVMTRALADTAKINREDPRAAAVIAALGGATAGAAAAPAVARLGKRILRRGR